MVPYLNYEVTTSLFKDYAMRKPAKAQLAKSLTSNVQPCEQTKEAMHVLDGGALLHKVTWAKKTTYKDLAIQYATCVRTNYGLCCIVLMAMIKVRQSKIMSIKGELGKDVQIYISMKPCKLMTTRESCYQMINNKASSYH